MAESNQIQRRKSQILQVLAKPVQAVLQKEDIAFDDLQEIRMRIGQPLIITSGGHEIIPSLYNENEHIVTKEEIREQAGRGKITFGLRGGADASEEDAVENAIQCFTDGIYRVFAGEEELTELEAPIGWKEDLVFTLIRLTMLSGW